MHTIAKHFEGKVAQKAIIVKRNKILITRDSNDEIWELPGGRLDESEEPIDAVKREISEELGLACTVKGVFDVTRMYHKRDDQWMLVIYYLVELLSEDFKLDPVEVAEMQWVDRDTWSKYEYFPAYQLVLEKYFNK